MHSSPPNPVDPDRRRFLLRLTKTGLAALAAGAIGYRFFDPNPPSGAPKGGSGARLADFSINGSGPQMAIVRGGQREKTVQSALAALGGIERFVRPGDRVLLKVNAAFASPPSLNATSHPELVKAVAGLCLKAGAGRVIVTDNPINDPQSCFDLTGISRAAKESGAEVMLPATRYFRPVTVPGATLLESWPVLFEPFRFVNKVIGLAPVKDHHRSGASMTLKNWYGLLGGRRNIFHQDIHTIITELGMLMRPTLVILDGTQTMMQNGPTGGSLSDLKDTNTMIVSTDGVAADAFGASLLERRLSDLPHIQSAAEAGAGTADWRSLNPAMLEIG
jgi:uncharacterized protein (DUF362 family)